MISIIVAASTNLVIGKNNDLPWHLPSDLKNFKELTNGSRIYMGRKCWESLPEKFRPLPNRENIVITRDKTYQAEGAVVLNDLELIKKSFELSSIRFGLIEQFVIGGAEIYKELFPVAQKLYLTEVLSDVDGDTYLEGYNPDEWDLIYESAIYEENGFKFRFKNFLIKI